MTSTTIALAENTGAVIEKAKALNTTQRRSLIKVVQNDFKIAKAQIKEQAQQAIWNAHEEAQRARSRQDAKVREITDAVNKVLYNDTAKRKITKILDAAREEGIDFYEPWNYYRDCLTIRSGARSHYAAVEEKIRKAERLALLTLERQQNEVERALLLAGLTDEATAILSTIPSAEELFSESLAQAEQQAA